MYKIIYDERERTEFLSNYFGPRVELFESIVFLLAKAVIDEYQGGEWKVAITDNNKIPFMFLNKDKTEVSNLHGDSSFSLNGDLAGMVVCVFAACYFSEKFNRGNDKFFSMYKNLLNDAHLLADKQNSSTEFSRLTGYDEYYFRED